MYGCESWTIKKAEHQRIDAFQIVVLERTLDSQPVFIGRSVAEAPILSLPDAKSRLIGKDPDDGKDWWQKDKGAAEDKVVS